MQPRPILRMRPGQNRPQICLSFSNMKFKIADLLPMNLVKSEGFEMTAESRRSSAIKVVCDKDLCNVTALVALAVDESWGKNPDYLEFSI